MPKPPCLSKDSPLVGRPSLLFRVTWIRATRASTMNALCGGCGGVGTVHFLEEAGTEVCTECAALAGECALDAPHNAAAQAAEPWPTDAEKHLRHHTYDAAAARRAAQRRREAQYTGVIHSAAIRLGYEYASERATALFMSCEGQRAAAAAVAAAALYAVLRSDRRAVDALAVAIAIEVPLAALVRAFRLLRDRAPFHDVYLDDPSIYTAGHIDFLLLISDQIPPPHGERLHGTEKEKAQWLANVIAQSCVAYELTGLDMLPFAFAIALHAIEGALQRTLTIRRLLPYAHGAMSHRLRAGCIAAPPSGSASTILARYAEIEKMLVHAIAQLPWVSNRPKKRKLGRRDVALYLGDAAHMWVKHGVPKPLAAQWTKAFRSEVPQKDDAPAVRRPTIAERLGLTHAAIDAMGDDQVDRILFSREELLSYFRTPEEQAVLCQLKGWDGEEAVAPKPVTQDTPHRLRNDPELYTPLDPADLSDGSDWEA